MKSAVQQLLGLHAGKQGNHSSCWRDMVCGDASTRQEWVKFTTIFQERNTLVTFRKISLWWCAAVLLFPVPELCPWFFSFRQIPNIWLAPSSRERERNGVETGKRILGNCPHILHPCIKKKPKKKSLDLSANLYVLKLGQAGFLIRAWSLTVLVTCLYHLTQGQEGGGDVFPKRRGRICSRVQGPSLPLCQIGSTTFPTSLSAQLLSNLLCLCYKTWLLRSMSIARGHRNNRVSCFKSCA